MTKKEVSHQFNLVIFIVNMYIIYYCLNFHLNKVYKVNLFSCKKSFVGNTFCALQIQSFSVIDFKRIVRATISKKPFRNSVTRTLYELLVTYNIGTQKFCFSEGNSLAPKSIKRKVENFAFTRSKK